MSSPFKSSKRACSHSSTSPTDSDSILDDQVDLSDDEQADLPNNDADLLDNMASCSSDESEPEGSQPSQHSSPPLVASDSSTMDSDSEDDTRDAENTAADERAIREIVGILRRRKWNLTRFLCVYMNSGERPKRRIRGVQKAVKDPEVCKLAGLPQRDVVPDGANLLPALRKEFK